MMEVSGDNSRQPVVVLMCGVAGSGKTTYAQRLEADGYARLSIDEEIWARFGRYGIDYDPAAYPQYGPIADAHLRQRLLNLIAEGRDVVVDSSFWRRSSREEYKQLIEASGARWRLIYLDAAPHLLRRRLAQRSLRFDANAAFPIDEATLTCFLNGFEVPNGEGEEVITVSG